MILGCEVRKKLRKALLVVLMVMVAGTFMTWESFGASKMRVEWFNVGAGDSMFVKFPSGRTVLIDGGTVSRGSSVVAKLKKMHINTITFCISTHPDADHVGGLQTVFREMKVKHFYYPNDTKYSTKTARTVVSLARKEAGCTLHHPKSGEKLKGGDGAYLQFVQRNYDYSTDNEDSLASYISYGKLQILTCGDNEDGSEEALTKHNVDILQLPHHGSKYATSSAFIRRFDPEKVVVSTDGHKYHHPNVEVFKRCRKYDSKIQVWRTDKKGDIVVTATKSKWKFAKAGVAVSKYCKATASTGTTGGGATKGYVYITKTGKKYHRIKNCRGLANANAIYKVKLSTAKAKGLTKCAICY